MPLSRNYALNAHYSAGASVVFFVVFFGSSTTGSTIGASTTGVSTTGAGATGSAVFHGFAQDVM
jgi:hypothetical protein